MTLNSQLGPRVTVKRIQSLFGDAGPFDGVIWERQFDKADDMLVELARTPWEKLLFLPSFWAYYHDLTYVDLQPELFAYLFPACLVMAQERLMAGFEGLGQGDSDFIRSLAARNWTSACSPGQLEGTYQILIDGFLDRLDRQQGFQELSAVGEASDWASRYNWIGRFNSLALILPTIEPLWQEWWDMGSQGQAIASVEFAWSFATPDDPQDYLDTVLPFEGKPSVEPDGSIFNQAWGSKSSDFLESILTYDYLIRKVDQAIQTLEGSSEGLKTRSVLRQLLRRRELAENRIKSFVAASREPWSSY